MKKIAIVVAMFMLASPAWAVVDVNIIPVPIGTTGDVNITYVADANISGFGLDITVDTGANITAINNFHFGESNSTAKGFGIFPGSIDINSVTGQVDYYGTPAAPNDDPCALGGIGTAGVTIEMGALYEDGYQPDWTGTLCTVTVSADCNITVALNARRGGVVREDFADANTNLPITVPVTVVSLCTVPSILGMTGADANAAIISAGLSVGAIDWDTSWTVDVNLVMAQDPIGGTQVSCNPSTVGYTMSSGCYPRGVGYGTWISVGQPNCWCDPRQCHGDVGNLEGTAKGGYYYVGAADLQVLLDAWKILEPPDGPGVTEPNICADWDRAKEGTAKGGYYRVGAGDLQILLDNWKILEPPDGPGIPADCQ